MRVLLLDNYDSFTYILADYLMQAGASVTVKRNDQINPQTLDNLEPQAICLSPGPGRPESSGGLMPLLQYWHTSIPILGVCLGHQAIGQLLGCRLVHAIAPVHGKTSPITADNTHSMFQGMPAAFQVMRYHSLILTTPVHPDLLPLAFTPEGELMAMAHKNLPLWGVQYHPESILTAYGLHLLHNWLQCARHHQQHRVRT
jgi:anthranilate synthase/aminodeoxychorismate synthase-like glutamine amidotransferase